MLFEGKSIQVQPVENGIYEVVFDRKDDAVNKLDRATTAELHEAVAVVQAIDDLQGVIFTSAKESFIVGADITEFMGFFTQEDDVLIAGLMETHGLLNQIEDLKAPHRYSN
jgi:3-hydroxyacyl-CoA dehydrogenase / enoyl-CoA hydratase / 3-hydroxybutyryl-CoA epimerase / enoyl-CoA isomerase